MNIKQFRYSTDNLGYLVYGKQLAGAIDGGATDAILDFIAGDTLFNGTIGNCFSGDLQGFYNSIKMLMAFPAETVIYAGHDYVQESLAFAKSLEPDNRDIDHFIETYNPAHVRSTLQDEFKINPYLRFNDEKIVVMLKARGLQTASEYERWESMYSIE